MTTITKCKQTRSYRHRIKSQEISYLTHATAVTLSLTEMSKNCRRSLGASAVRWFFAFFSVCTKPTALKLLEVLMYTGGMDFINKYS